MRRGVGGGIFVVDLIVVVVVVVLVVRFSLVAGTEAGG